MKLTPSARKHLILEVLVLLAAALMLLRPAAGNEYRRYATDTLRYVRGRLLEVVSQDLTDSTLGTGQKLGSQRLLVRLPDGQESESLPEPSGERQVVLGLPESFRAAQNTTCYVRLNMNFPSSN